MASGTPVYDPAAFDDVLRDARGRIRDVRMRDVELRLTKRNGEPLTGTSVRVEQLGSAFLFGDQVWHLDALIRDGRGDSDRAIAWKQRFAELFNAATNLCYWTERPRLDASKTEDRQGEPRLANFAETVAWTRSEGMTAKGHPLFWSIPKCVPEWVKRYDVATQMKFAEVRVRSLVARYRGKIAVWDAVNEPMWEAAPKNLSRREWPHLESIEDIVEYVEPVLRWCREEDPDAAFLVNDYGMEHDGLSPPRLPDGCTVTSASQRRRFLALLRALSDRGVPPDAVGLQSHTGGWLDHRSQMAVYDEFAASRLPIHITEFGCGTKALEESGELSRETIDELQAEYVVNAVTCAFAHSAVEAFFCWGFMDSVMEWRDGLSGHEPRPAFDRLKNLLHDEWRTRIDLRTDADGVVRFRGFLGNYTVRVPLGPMLKGIPFVVSSDRAARVDLTSPGQ